MKKDKQEVDSEAMQGLALGLLAYVQVHGDEIAPHHPIWHRIGVASGLILLLLVAVWLSGNLFGMKYDLQGNQLSAQSSDAELERRIQEIGAGYRIRIVQPDGSEAKFSLKEVGLQVRADQSVALGRDKQRSWANRLQWWRVIPLNLVLTTDVPAMEAFISQHATVAVEAPKDASLSITDGVVQLTDGANGKQYGFTDPTHSILTAASELRTTPLRMRVVAQQPAVTAQALASTKTHLEAVLKQSVTIKIDTELIHPTPKDIADWIILTPEQSKKDGELEC